MSGDATGDERSIRVGQTTDGDPVSLPVEQVLTGRAFVTGKSGSGKSNTASVVVEELLEAGFPVLIVDTDGEYYGLKETYELLHVGADEECDLQVGPEHATKLADLALEQNVPIILDVSGFLDTDAADELIRETARHLFAREKKLKKPFLLVVEEVHEYIPEGAGMGDTGQMLIKIGKRGRKHGLGLLGISQRPADVKKDFITQANWLVWHRLTWDNDTRVVSRIVGSEYGEAVPELEDGQAFVQTDWTDDAVRTVQFRRKRTFDAGATPGLEDVERPDLKSVSDDLTADLADITEEEERREDRIEELESELEARQERIDELEAELERARDVSHAAERIADTIATAGGGDGDGGGGSTGAAIKRETVDRLQRERDELERKLDRAERTIARLEGGDDGEVTAPATPTTAVDNAAAGGEETSEGDDTESEDDEAQTTLEDAATETADGSAADAAADGGATSRSSHAADEPDEADGADEASDAGADESSDAAHPDEAPPDSPGDAEDDDAVVAAFREQLQRTGERLLAAEGGDDLAALLSDDRVTDAIAAARSESLCSRGEADLLTAALRRDGPVPLTDLAGRVDADTGAVQGFLTALRSRNLVVEDEDGWRFDREALVAVAGGE